MTSSSLLLLLPLLVSLSSALRQPSSLLPAVVLHASQSSNAQGEAAPQPLFSPKPSLVKADIEAALANLSQAACAGGQDKLLSLIGDNITVLAPGIGPLTLFAPADVASFFETSFLPCGVEFVVSDVVVGNGALVPPPVAADAAADSARKLSSVTGGKSSLAVSLITYADLATNTVGKALALWVLAGKRKIPKPTPANDDHYFWNLTVIGWNSDSLDNEHAAALDQSSAEKTAEELSDARSDSINSALSTSDQTSPRRFMRQGDEKSPLENKKVDTYAALDEAVGYFTANLSAGDAGNASLFFTTTHPLVYLNAYKPALVATTPAEKLAYTESLLGLELQYTHLQVWAFKAIASVTSAVGGGGKLDNAFSITKLEADNNGTILTGHTLRLWETNIFLPGPTALAPSAAGSKVVQITNRWVLFAPSEVPAPTPSPSPVAPPPESPSPDTPPPDAPPPDTPAPDTPGPEAWVAKVLLG